MEEVEETSGRCIAAALKESVVAAMLRCNMKKWAL
jgi:hypothetical protein